MGRGFLIAAALASALVLMLAGTGLAADARAIRLTDGPDGSGRPLGAAWSMACPPQTRLAGMRLHEDGTAIIGVESLCVRLTREGALTAWVGRPAVAELPEPQMEARPVVEAAAAPAESPAESHLLRVRSDSVSRFSGSRAMLITVSREPEPVRAGYGARVSFEPGARQRDLICPDGAYMQGVRTGTAGQRTGLMAVQIICTRDGTRTEIVGDWGDGARKPRTPLTAARTQCGGGIVNPHDGTAARALIGTAEDGRIVSLGLLCARTAVPGRLSDAAYAVRRWLAGLVAAPRRTGAKTYRSPQWYAGSAVAVCRDGSGRGYCAQASADRFCATMRGAGAATFYVVGPYAADAIAAGGKRCPAGACRAFQAITCSG